MEIDVISEQEVRQIALNTVCEYIKEDEWCEDGSVRMDIKHLNKVVGDLKYAIHQLQKQANITTEVVTTMAKMIEILERKI